MYHACIDTPVGPISLYAGDQGLTRLSLSAEGTGGESNTAIHEATRQLNAYFSGKLAAFDLVLDLNDGTLFQQKVWSAVTKIPYASTTCYRDIAATLDNPGAIRAVGMANSRNPLPIIIPCHRVIGSDGSLTGYVYGLQVKRQLLALEDPTRWGPTQGALW